MKVDAHEFLIRITLERKKREKEKKRQEIAVIKGAGIYINFLCEL